MSLTETDEEREYWRGYSEGKVDGKLSAMKEIGEFVKNDGGMIPVESIRQKLIVMRSKL